MKSNKNYKLFAKIDENMNAIVANIKEEIRTGVYEIKDWDSFVETSILVFQKMIENGITPFMFDSFVETNKKVKNVMNECDA